MLQSSLMPLHRSAHAVYDCHLVWCPKYRKAVMAGVIGARLRALFVEIGMAYDISIEEMEVASDHVHLFCAFSPKLSITQVVTRLKSLSARAIFAEFPQVKRQLWGGEFWENGYFARTVGEEVTADIIRRCIARHRDRPDGRNFTEPLDLFPTPDQSG